MTRENSAPDQHLSMTLCCEKCRRSSRKIEHFRSESMWVLNFRFSLHCMLNCVDWNWATHLRMHELCSNVALSFTREVKRLCVVELSRKTPVTRSIVRSACGVLCLVTKWKEDCSSQRLLLFAILRLCTPILFICTAHFHTNSSVSLPCSVWCLQLHLLRLLHFDLCRPTVNGDVNRFVIWCRYCKYLFCARNMS
jgi:hypothetical protein